MNRYGKRLIHQKPRVSAQIKRQK